MPPAQGVYGTGERRRRAEGGREERWRRKQPTRATSVEYEAAKSWTRGATDGSAESQQATTDPSCLSRRAQQAQRSHGGRPLPRYPADAALRSHKPARIDIRRKHERTARREAPHPPSSRTFGMPGIPQCQMSRLVCPFVLAGRAWKPYGCSLRQLRRSSCSRPRAIPLMVPTPRWRAEGGKRGTVVDRRWSKRARCPKRGGTPYARREGQVKRGGGG